MYIDTRAVAHFQESGLNKVGVFASENLFCDVYCLLPEQEQKVHAHELGDKIYHVLTGDCTVIIGDERRRLRGGELAVAPAGVPHGLLNHSAEPTTLLVIMAPNPTP